MLTRWSGVSELSHCLRQHFPWQRKINRAHGLALGDCQRPVDDGFELLAVAQLIVPLDRLAQHSRLIEHLLRPMNIQAAMTRESVVVGRGAWRRERCREGARGGG